MDSEEPVPRAAGMFVSPGDDVWSESWQEAGHSAALERGNGREMKCLIIAEENQILATSKFLWKATEVCKEKSLMA